MPRICEFYGIVIYMYFKDHSPPHFHAIYGRYEAEIDIRSCELSEGALPPRASRLVLEWARSYQVELLGNWERARARVPLAQIPPLD